MSKNIPINAIGKLIKEAREKKGLTIEELTWEINNSKIKEKDIKAFESGKQFPDLDMIYKLSQILELNPNELLKLRNLIQEQSYKKINPAARRVGDKVLTVIKPVIKLIFELVLGGSIIYLALNYKVFENKVVAPNDQEQIDFIANKIEEQIDIYVK